MRKIILGAVAVAAFVGGSCVPETPPNQSPIASPSATPSSGPAPLAVTFSSAGSTDPDGTIVSYAWAFGDGDTSTDANPVHTYAAAGTFTATLTVTDNLGANGAATVTVTATGVTNLPPTAVASATPSSGTTPLSVAFSSAGSADADGSIVSYDWDFGDGSPHDATPNPAHVYSSTGTFTVVLTVTDDVGATGSASATVVVSAVPNQAPTAVLQADTTSGLAPLTVNFDSGSSSDPDGTIVSRSLDFGDGSPASSATAPSHVYAAAGVYTAVVTVTDDDGATATASKSITVIGSTVTPSSGPAGSTITVNVPCEQASSGPLAATAIAALVSVPDGTVVVTNAVDNSTSGQPNADVPLVIPPGTPAGAYKVQSSCDRYMSSTPYADVPFTVT